MGSRAFRGAGRADYIGPTRYCKYRTKWVQYELKSPKAKENRRPWIPSGFGSPLHGSIPSEKTAARDEGVGEACEGQEERKAVVRPVDRGRLQASGLRHARDTHS